MDDMQIQNYTLVQFGSDLFISQARANAGLVYIDWLFLACKK